MTPDSALTLLDDLVKAALKAGATEAEAVLADSTSVSVQWREAKLEQLERSESSDLGLRVLIGKRQAMVSSSDRSPAALAELVDRALAMAHAVPEDPYTGLAEPGQLATSFPDLDLCDPNEPSVETLLDMNRRAEEAMMAVPGVTLSDGTRAGWGRSNVAMAASNGFTHTRSATSSSISASALAGDHIDARETDYDYAQAVHMSDLRAPEDVGREAGKRTVERLGARKVETCKVPVIFDPRVSAGMISSLASAINGATVARGTSFLKDSLGKVLFKPGIRVMEDPHRPRGLRSRPFDGEGLPTRKSAIIEDGRLTTWLLDLRSARQLGLPPTGHASRGIGSPPSPSVSNLYLEPGPLTPAQLMADIAQGFYVTQLFGSGVNIVTGDYSRGASGFWIENGQLSYAVAEVTIAGNLKDIFPELTPASDLVFRHGIDSPTIRVDGLTLAGR